MKANSPYLPGFALAITLFTLPLRADISGTPTLAVNATLNLDTGATGTSGGDLVWTGSALNAQSGVTLVAIPGVTAQLFDSLTADIVRGILALGGTSVAVPSPSAGPVIAVKTKAGNFAKLVVAGGTAGGSINIKFTTFGVSGGGGGGGASGPSITTVQNNYSQIAKGLPNYGIAPGTLFFVQGANLAATTTDLLSSAAPGLPTTRDGVSVSVTSGGASAAPCPIYYLSPTQIDAVLPDATPLGDATITVTNNGASATFSITVVQSAFGILNYNGGLGAVYDVGNNLLTSSNSANPNQAIVLWGSGTGADPANDDRLFPQKQNNLTNIPMQAFIGGVPATIAYRGRSQFPALDQVVLTIPGNAPTGCFVSLAIVSGNIVSNSVTIPIAASGKTCTDGGAALPTDLQQSLSGKTTIRQGFLSVQQFTQISSRGANVLNSALGSFQSVTGFANSSGANQSSSGSCVVYSNFSGGSSSGTVIGLDAGSAISVTGPGGSLTLSQLSIPGAPGGLYFPGGDVPATFIPSGGGSYTFDNGSGGKDIPHFSATLNVPPAFTWTNAGQISSVSRTQGVNVTWSGGAPGTFVSITGSSFATVNGAPVSVVFACQAPIAAGQFSVPSPVLLALPTGTGSLSVGDYSAFQQFSAPGLDFAFLSAGNGTLKELPYTN